MTSLAGTEYTLVCTATKDVSLTTAILEVEWFGPNGNLITGTEEGITVTGQASTTDTELTSSLTFTSLKTSQGGEYTCSVNLTIPEANVTDHNVRRTSAVRVQSKYDLLKRTFGHALRYTYQQFTWKYFIMPCIV